MGNKGKNIVVVIVLLLILMVWVWNQQQVVSDASNKNEIERKEQKVTSTQSVITSKMLAEKAEALSLELDQLTNNQAFLGTVTLIRSSAMFCNQIERYKQDSRMQLETFGKIINQKSYACESFKSKWPVLTDSHIDWKQMTATNEVDSMLKDLVLQSGRADTPLTAKKLFDVALEEKNAQLLFLVTHKRFKLWESQRNTLKNKLRGGGVKYIEDVSNLAVEVAGCGWQPSGDCDPSSDTMIKKCLKRQDICGLSFFDWYEQNITPGVRKDVQNLTEYFIKHD